MMGPSNDLYVDVATQTSPFPSPLIAPASPASPITSFFTALSTPAYSRSTALESPRELEQDKHYNASENRYIRSSETPGSPHLPFVPSSFGLQRHSTTRTPHSNNRTVSLPGTLYDEDLRLVLSQLIENGTPENREQPRVVSMPESARWQTDRPTSPDALEYREFEEPSLETVQSDDVPQSEGSMSSSSPSTPRTVVMHSLSSDQFHTPSPPPSSCDSVEFTLEDPVRISESFLRGSSLPPTFVPAAARKTAALLEDDGWVTWANSPPRPIPALHGPSSLPYARCPSGAEGTIIGEQSSLPRMIWGLDPNDSLPTPHIPHQQQSRAVPIKPPADHLRRGSQPGPPLVNPTSATFSPSLAPRLSYTDSSYHLFEELPNGRRVPVSLARPEERSESAFRGMEKGRTGLGFSVSEAQMSLGPRYESGMRDGSMDSSQSYRAQNFNIMDSDIEIISVEEEAEKQRQLEAQNLQERFGTQAHSISSQTRGGIPPNFVELLSSPVRLPMHKPLIPSAAPRHVLLDPAPGYLPTPPSSSSPQWSSVFTLPTQGQFPTNFADNASDPAANFKILSKMSTTNDELSQELRRFVFENMSSSNTASGNALRTAAIAHPPSTSVFSPIYVASNASSGGSPIHPPGLPIPHHILLSQTPDPSRALPTQGAFPQASASPSASTYTRSTLSNPRSIPLSRLRQKGGAVKLATVPEEDASEGSARDGRLLGPPAHAPRSSLRTPSPLPDSLQPQSVIEKTGFGEEDLKVGTLRVKLPHTMDEHGTTTSKESPKKKRLQRRRKPATSKLAEPSRVGFPLVSGGPVSFGSIPNATHEEGRSQSKLGGTFP